jgi:hypothetical protein
MDEEELLWLEESRLDWVERTTFVEDFPQRNEVSGLSVVSLDEDGNDVDDEIEFPSYDDVLEDDDGNTSSLSVFPEIEPKDDTVEYQDDATSVLRPTFPILDFTDKIEHSVDDTAIRIEPSRHVDYLAHDWHEEDIWSSWRYVRSNRTECENSERLENAAWRTWEKRRSNLKTVAPETLNWMKDCDTTWLYGPLRVSSRTPRSRSKDSSSDYACPLDIKPILKKRRASDIMLHRSPSLSLTTASDSGDEFSAPAMSRSSTASSSYSSISSASSTFSRKSVRFHDRVEQFIAVDTTKDEESYVLIHSDTDKTLPETTQPSKRRDAFSTVESPKLRSSIVSPTTATSIVTKLPCTKLRNVRDIVSASTSNKTSNYSLFEQPMKLNFEYQEYMQAERDGDLEWEYSMIGMDSVSPHSISVR